MNLSTVTYDSRYLPQVEKLWAEQYEERGLEKRKQLFEWVNGGNPFMNGVRPYYLLLDGEKVVGMHGMMPLWFTVHGKKQRGYFAHDILLSKDYRGKGLGKIILQQMMLKTDSFAGALWFNEPNYRLYQKAGWLDIPNLSAYVKIYDPAYFVESMVQNRVFKKLIVGLVVTAMAVWNKLCIKSSKQNIRITKVERFDSSIDSLFKETANRYGIMAMRSHEYLNWKFSKKPFNNYHKYIAYDEYGKPSGYIVMKTDKLRNAERGKILDFLVHPEQTEIFRAMLLHCCEELDKKNVTYVQFMTSSSVLAEIAKKCGFMKARKPVRFMVKNWENVFAKDFVANKENWYVTESDGDGDAWTVDK